MHATKAAVEEGIVAGGGVALIRQLGTLENLDLEGDQKLGADIIRKSLPAPLKAIADNAGQEGSVVLREVMDQTGANGYNAATNTYEDLLKAGVIDPVKVTKNALLNAASVASVMLTTEAVITEIPEEKPAAPAMPDAGGMGMY